LDSVGRLSIAAKPGVGYGNPTYGSVLKKKKELF